MPKHIKIILGVTALVIVFLLGRQFSGAPVTFITSSLVGKMAPAMEMDYYDGGATDASVRSFKSESMAGVVDDFAANTIIAPEPPGMPGFETGGGEEFIPEEPLVIRTANLSVVVDDVKVAADNIAAYAREKGGFEVSRNLYKRNGGLSGYVTVRVPSKNFDEGLDVVRGEGEVQSQQVNGQDVTEEFVDVSAQLANLRATEEQFLTIMRRATEIEDILNVQRELSSVRGQIERLEGRKRYLETSASLSTITVNLSTDPSQLPVVDEGDTWKPLAVLKNSARGLVGVFQGIANFIILLVVYIPLWILIALVVWIIIKVWKKYHRAE